MHEFKIRPLLIGFLLLSGITSSIAQREIFSSGTFLTSPESGIQLKAGFRLQNLFISETLMDGSTPWQANHQFRRARLKIKGSTMSSKLAFVLQFGFSESDLKPPSMEDLDGKLVSGVIDAVLKWNINEDIAIWVGQTKLPGNRERLTSSKKLQFVDRSRVNSIFNLDREFGLQLHGDFNLENAILRPAVSVSMGEGRNLLVNNAGGYHYVGRLEILPFGAFYDEGEYEEVDLYREPKPKLAIGASYSLNMGASRQKQSGKFLAKQSGELLENDLRTILLDLIFKYRGFTGMVEYSFKNNKDIDQPSLNKNLVSHMMDVDGNSYYTGHGFNVQLGHILPSNWDAGFRFTKTVPDREWSFIGANEYTLGIGKYIVDHNFKFQSDFSIIDSPGEALDEIRYRFQMDISF